MTSYDRQMENQVRTALYAALYTALGTQVTKRTEVVDGRARWSVPAEPHEPPTEVAQIGLWFEVDTWPRQGGLLPQLELYSYPGWYEMSGIDNYVLDEP
jgi:hypothetical protein